MTARQGLKRALIPTWLVMLATLPSQAAKESACVMTQATIAQNEAGIRETMAAYNAALNGCKTAAVLPLYTEDGVFMPPYSQSAVGRSAVSTAYDKVFEELQFDVKFTIDELVVMAPNWAYVRTNSAGTTFHRSLGKKLAEANQELSSSIRATTANGASPATASRRPIPRPSEGAPDAGHICPG